MNEKFELLKKYIPEEYKHIYEKEFYRKSIVFSIEADLSIYLNLERNLTKENLNKLIEFYGDEEKFTEEIKILCNEDAKAIEEMKTPEFKKEYEYYKQNYKTMVID